MEQAEAPWASNADQNSPNSPAVQAGTWTRLPPTPNSEVAPINAAVEAAALWQQQQQSPRQQNSEQEQDQHPIQPNIVRFADVQQPGMIQKRPSMLSRSKTLSRLQNASRERGAEMNYYSNYNQHNWFLSIRWIFKGSGVNMFMPLGLITIYSTIVVSIVEALHIEARVDMDTDVTSGIGGCMALLLAFRLNVCYSRWWEGRMLWGGVIESARSIVTIALSLEADVEPNSELAKRRRADAEGLAGWSIAFAVALKFHLRGDKFSEDPHLSRSIQRLLKGKGLAFGSNAIHRLKHSGHPPLHALRSIRHSCRRVLMRQREDGYEATALENTLNDLSGVMHGSLTGCERILRTPCPPGYVGVLRLSLVFFLCLLPFVLLEIGCEQSSAGLFERTHCHASCAPLPPALPPARRLCALLLEGLSYRTRTALASR